MARPKATPKDEQRPFEIHELFFSTTDRAGVILSGNEVFRRVAAFDNVEEMIGKPHNIIRHPDMPRAVFRLLWDFLEAGRPIAAYVKNLAKDGAYYWVLALVVSTPDGYLSVRFKPSSPYLGVVQELYKVLLAVEAEGGDRPGLRQTAMEKAGVRLLDALREHGFDSYDDFMKMALATEMSSREKSMADYRHAVPPLSADPDLVRSFSTCCELEQKLDVMFHRVESFLTFIGRLEASSTFLGRLSEQVHLLSLNSLISSHQMGEAGASLTVVANELASISGDSTSLIGDMTADIRELVAALREAAFRISVAKLQVGISITFLEELLAGRSDMETNDRERNDLKVLAWVFSQAANDLEAVIPILRAPMALVTRRSEGLTTFVRSLSRVHLIGRVEAAHVRNAGRFLELFDEVAHQLEAAQTELRDFAQSISSLSEGLPNFEADSVLLRARLSDLEIVAA